MISSLDREVFIKSVGRLKKDAANGISACCPLCGDTKNRLHLVNVSSKDFSYVKCFNQGCSLEESTSILNFLKISNSPLVEYYKRKTLNKKIDQIKESKNLQDIINTITKPDTEAEIPKVLLDAFDKVTDVPEAMEYLQKRHLTPRADWLFSKEKFFTFNNKNIFVENYIIIPIWNSGKFKGWYSRCITEKAFSTFLLPDTPKFWVLDSSKSPDIICEGIFDSLSLNFENPAAAISADIPPEILEDLPKDVIIAFDNDKTGIQKSLKYSKHGFQIFVWPEIEFKDFNEALNTYTKEELTNIVRSNIYQGLEAEIRLRMKEV